MRYGFMTDAAQAAEQVAKRFRGIVPDHTKLVRAIATALIARERQVWEAGLKILERDKIHRCLREIKIEFRRRVQGLG